MLNLNDLKILHDNLSTKRTTKFLNSSISPPFTNLSELYLHSYRNRCLWMINVSVSHICEIEVFRRCLYCFHPIISSIIMTTVKIPTECQKCGTKLNEFSTEIWWKCTLLVDDGTAESIIYLEGSHAIQFLRMYYQEHLNCPLYYHLHHTDEYGDDYDYDCCENNNVNNNVNNNNNNFSNNIEERRNKMKLTFYDIQTLIESILSFYSIHIITTSSLSNVNPFSNSNSHSSSNDIPLDIICICQIYSELLYSYQQNHIHHNNYQSSLSSTNLLYFHNKLSFFMNNFILYLLNYSLFSHFQFYVKLIHQKLSNVNDFRLNPLNRYNKNQINHFIQNKNINFIENSQIKNETFETLKLDCCHLIQMNDNTRKDEESYLAWNIFNKL